VASSIYSGLSCARLKLSVKVLFQLILVLMVLCALTPVYGQQSLASRILPHTHSYFSALLQMDSAPAVTVADPGPSVEKTAKPGKLAKLGGKYDVARIGERGVGKGVNFYSIEKEQQLGQQFAKELESQTRVLTDPVITEYVNRVGQQLVRHSDAQVPFIIKVLDSDEVNAFALPGGYFYVNSGLILAADNEAELAGVMAHEIAHVAARHATRNATKSQIWNLVSLPMVFVGGPAGMIVRQVASLAVPMTFLKFSRDAEREADLLGLEYQYAAGYDPSALVDFFEKLEARHKKQNFVGKAFATHPMNEDRIRRAQKEISSMLPERDQYIITTSDFNEVKARLATLIARKPALPEPTGNKPVLRRPSRSDEAPGRDRPTLERK
jgi:beta-barrel assembly-enhancing protease